MEYQNYEEYMFKVLGYSPQNSNIYENYPYRDIAQDIYCRNENKKLLSEEEADLLYPKMYSIINPVICKMCSEIDEKVTEEVLEKMVDNVYKVIEKNETVVNIHIEVAKEAKETNNRVSSKESRNSSNKIQNPFIRDLIKILILKQLIGVERPPVRPMCPPYQGTPSTPIPRPPYPGGTPSTQIPRPPYPGGTQGAPMPRPPYPRSNYEDYLKF